MPPCRRPPHEWATKNEDMTDIQEDKLRELSEENGIYLSFLDPANHTGQRVTKSQAYFLIGRLIYGREVTRQYLDSLGRTGRYIRPPHPTTWYDCHSLPTEWQFDFIDDLATRLLIPLAATRKLTHGLTRGQASWLIDILRREKSRFMRPLDEKWLEATVADCIREVPLPKEEEDLVLPKLEAEVALLPIGGLEVKVEM